MKTHKHIDISRDRNGEAIKTSCVFSTDNGVISSPSAISSSIVEVAIPDGALEIVLMPSEDIRISEKSDMSSYFIIPSYVMYTEWVAGLDSIFLVRDDIDSTLHFKFNY